jgi:hypothetical protein
VTSKEIHECEVPKWKKEIAKIVCVSEKEIPTSFMDLQVHLLIHLVDTIELASFVSTRWMFFFERYMKNLEICVRQKAHLEGYMPEGYVLNVSFFFYLVRILKMGHAFGMKNKHQILLTEKDHNLMVFK